MPRLTHNELVRRNSKIAVGSAIIGALLLIVAWWIGFPSFTAGMCVAAGMALVCGAVLGWLHRNDEPGN